jgi:lipopolysaccharide transport system permease protein
MQIGEGFLCLATYNILECESARHQSAPVRRAADALRFQYFLAIIQRITMILLSCTSFESTIASTNEKVSTEYMAEHVYGTVVEPRNGWFDLHLKEVWKYRDLIMLFVKRDFVAQYKQTILGPAWAIIQPFLTTVVFSVFFGSIAGLGAAGVPNLIFYLSGTILWTYFSTCLTTTANTFVSNSAILGKVYFPRLVMPISVTISKLIAFVIQYAFMLIFLVYYILIHENVHPNLLVFITPLLVIELAMLGLGCGIIVSAVTTKYRDLAMLVAFGTQLWMYISPVAYDMSIIPARFVWLYMLNPVTPIVTMFRYAYLGIGAPCWGYYGISWIITAVLLLLGIVLFSHVEKTFMDTV